MKKVIIIVAAAIIALLSIVIFSNLDAFTEGVQEGFEQTADIPETEN